MSAIRIIANPKAGRGRAGDGLRGLVSELRTAGRTVDVRESERPGHAAELAAAARRDGLGTVVAAGGDGTIHEVANGLLGDDAGGDAGADESVPALGIVALGSGCDYIRTFGIRPGVEGAAERLLSDRAPAVVDAGRVTCVGTDGSRVDRVFVNIAEVGLGPAVVQRALRLPRALGPAVYFAAFWLTLPGYRPPEAMVTADRAEHPGVLTNLVVAIGRAFGGGMLVAPNADPADGRFDVQIHRGSKADYVRGIPKVYRGTHLPHPKIAEASAAIVDVSAAPDVLVEADGEVLGATPASFRIVPNALRVIV